LFGRHILWTNEATFTRAGIFNKKNAHYWAHENPNLTHVSSHQHQFKVNHWLGVLGRDLLAPAILPDRLNAQEYLEFLNNDLPLAL
ncbi:hypothetical protein SGI37_20480, partial [Providencia rettgeri]